MTITQMHGWWTYLYPFGKRRRVRQHQIVTGKIKRFYRPRHQRQVPFISFLHARQVLQKTCPDVPGRIHFSGSPLIVHQGIDRSVWEKFVKALQNSFGTPDLSQKIMHQSDSHELIVPARSLSQKQNKGFENNIQIQPHRPVFNIKQIQLDLFFKW